MLPQWIIEKKRDGNALGEDEIRSFIEGYASGSIPEYQMSALAMAIYFQGMTTEEVAVLTDAMMRSGDLMDTSCIEAPKADKHSTGGIGDKVSLILAPLVACSGVVVPMISGRGLGITGGTLDKMESIQGYRTDLSRDEFFNILDKCGCSIIGQTAELAPADKKLYSLRDVTGTVPSIPLISASIMCKKLAEGIDSLVLDVKWGTGAFMKTPEDAHKLARSMVDIGRRMNKGMTALVTDMNQPLGRTAGNAVEVLESVDALKGNGTADLMDVTLALAANMLVLSNRAGNVDDARQELMGHIDSGAAYEKFCEMVVLHGGSVKALENPAMLPTAGVICDFPAAETGYVLKVDAECIGKACAVLGAGRATVVDTVDHAVGITGLVKVGEYVEKGQPLLCIHANDQHKLEEAKVFFESAFAFSEEKSSGMDLIVETIS